MELSDSDVLAIHQLLGLWGHVLDGREWDRLDELLTEDATYDCSVFGFDVASGIESIHAVLDDGEHALAHHATNIVVADTTDAGVTVVSKGIGVLPGGVISSATYIDSLRRTDSGWRIAARTLTVPLTRGPDVD